MLGGGGTDLTRVHAITQVTFETLDAVDTEMERLLNDAYGAVQEMLARNRAAFDALIEQLCGREDNTLFGDDVREIVEQHGCREDLDRRNLERAAFL